MASEDAAERAPAFAAPPVLSTPARSDALEPLQPSTAPHTPLSTAEVPSTAELDVRRSIDDNAATILRRLPVVVSALPALQGA